jgi:hypothetical protein
VKRESDDGRDSKGGTDGIESSRKASGFAFEPSDGVGTDEAAQVAERIDQCNASRNPRDLKEIRTACSTVAL